ncbi:MAG: YggS family pyridoxal phosphate-dependent enzyme [Flavobacteriales bacterium]|nr:YggS family pyridoxal phosphate-dependent enzyme [Flavobacteriales bacterium]
MDTTALKERYDRVKAALPPNVTLVAVSKTRTVEEIRALYDLGHRDFGENYPQELRDKQPLLPADIRWHFIGHLQTNKVKYLAPFVHLVHAVDSERLLDELDKRAAATGRTIDVLLQLRIAAEDTKHGSQEHDLRALLKAFGAGRWPGLRARGLMGMATLTRDREQVRREFARLGALYRSLHAENSVDHATFDTLSMGMSDDADLAIAEGSTMVRIGTALFGPRG